MQIALVLLAVILVIVILLAVVVLVRTLSFKPPAAPATDAIDFDPGVVAPKAIERLSAAIRIPTLSNLDYETTDFAPFDEFLAWLPQAFPLFHEHTERTVVNDYALIYRWPGKNPSLDPIALMAHYDVVPIEEGTEQDWQQQPFSGAVVDGIVWGRGTLDIKSQLIAHMEATEGLLKEGFTPTRDIYFCYGHDEEVGGRQGAIKIVEHLKQNGVRFAGVLDEGGVVITGALANVKGPIGLIGIAEKGTSNYHFEVPGAGGHSSMPPTHTSLGLAAQIIERIETRPLPLRLTPPAELMLRTLSGQMGFVVRMAVSNLWLFRGILLKILAKNPVTNALARTTFAVTMAEASDACNVLPQTTRFNVNVRILSGDTPQSVKAHFEKLMNEVDSKAQVSLLLEENASPISPIDSELYRMVEELINEMYPSALVSPYLVMGGTDSRQFYALSDNVLRFTPMHISQAEQQSMHSTNECVSVVNYGRMIAFFERLLKRL
jgi:carboxypeptidase PM20D1